MAPEVHGLDMVPSEVSVGQWSACAPLRAQRGNKRQQASTPTPAGLSLTDSPQGIENIIGLLKTLNELCGYDKIAFQTGSHRSPAR